VIKVAASAQLTGFSDNQHGRWSDRVTLEHCALLVGLVSGLGKIRRDTENGTMSDADGGRSPVNPEATQVDDIRLVALPTAINCAELFVRFALTEWSLTPMMDEASDVVRDLTSAAVEVADPGVPAFITVRARVHGDRLVVEVESGKPTRPPTNLDGPNGWRAGVVELRGRRQLAWCELPLPGGMDASSVPLPRRHHRKGGNAAPPVEEEPLAGLRDASDVDEDVMRRILYGLGGAGGHAE
jgi:hypothetical protein